jgi:hypothetical protein
MITVKLTTPWSHPYLAQTPNGLGIWGNYKFEINNDCDEADYWFVWGGLPKSIKKMTVRAPKGHTIYISDEAHIKRVFSQGFINQFTYLLSCRQDIFHKNHIFYREIAPWYLPATWDTMAQMKATQKTKDLSLISSDLLFLESHKQRFAFVNKMIGHFKGNLDAYGRGINPLENKFDAFLPYRYTIALENSYLPNYFTEKPREPFLCYTFPFYWGCPNLQDYFDPDSFIRLDLNDFRKSIEIIEDAIAHNVYDQRFDLIVAMRQKVLCEYHIFPDLVRFIETFLPESASYSAQTIRFEEYFRRLDNSKMRNLLKKNPLIASAKKWLGK